MKIKTQRKNVDVIDNNLTNNTENIYCQNCNSDSDIVLDDDVILVDDDVILVDDTIEKKSAKPRNKCPHGKQKSQCVDCGGSGICVHKKQKRYCKDCKGSSICEHKKRKSQCKGCKGSNICEHGKQKSRCKECGGTALCEHERQKAHCVKCKGSSICEHGKRKSRCKICDGSDFCEHGKRKEQCVDCGGSQICIHKKKKSTCLECNGSQICIHKKHKSQCRECKGSSFCIHDKQKAYCKTCGGSKLCMSTWCHTIGMKKYERYCAYCYTNLFPDKIVARNYKTRELNVGDNVTDCYPDLTWIRDKRIQDGCSKRKPDMLVDLGTHIIIVEVDENAHKDYDCSCENKRIMEISKDVGGRPIVFIRFNPDKYVDVTGKTITSCWKLNKTSGILHIDPKKETEWKERINALCEQIQYWIDNPSDKTVEIIELFY
jgi:hypothetical protein